MSALDLLVRTINAQKFGRPFYSKLDEALQNLPRQKGTADEFMRELEKQPGVKKAEIEDRGVKKALAARARAPDANKPITKQQMQKILYDQAPYPPVIEDVLGGKDVQYQKWRTPGGKNYREILLKLPEDYLNDPYIADHFGDNPNILAHIRVSDYEIPNKGFLVVNTKSGNRSEAFKTAEEAQAYLDSMPESMRPSLKITEGQGTPKKVLLVDEIQSDWHQAGRSEGYYSPYAQRNLEVDKRLYEYAQEDKEKAKAAMEAAQAAGDTAAYEASRDKYLDLVQRSMQLDTQIATQKQTLERGVPDAPFKKNWHELAMKRVLDYAAGNGYDSIAITPGAEQAKRYDLSKQVEQIMSVKEDGGVRIFARDNRGKNHDMGVFPPDQLSGVVGKDLAEKIAAQEKPTDIYQGVDLQVGGEGMKGFYDKILPDYLNNFGKQYGASVREAPLNYVPSAKQVAQGEEADALLGQLGVDIPTVAPTQYHMFDITPQLREEVKSKGLPLYSKMAAPDAGSLAAGSGAATIGSQMFDENNEQQVQNPVHFTENPDAMLLELMQRN
jgi:hypothetical protein